MDKVYNIKITLNDKSFFICEPQYKTIGLELFDSFAIYAKKFSMNDDGGKYKNTLKSFDISKDKKFGNI